VQKVGGLIPSRVKSNTEKLTLVASLDSVHHLRTRAGQVDLALV